MKAFLVTLLATAIGGTLLTGCATTGKVPAPERFLVEAFPESWRVMEVERTEHAFSYRVNIEGSGLVISGFDPVHSRGWGGGPRGLSLGDRSRLAIIRIQERSWLLNTPDNIPHVHFAGYEGARLHLFVVFDPGFDRERTVKTLHQISRALETS